MQKLILIIFFIISATFLLSGDEEYSFDLSSVQKKTFQINGYAEIRPVLYNLNRESRLYYLRFFNIDEGDYISEYNFNSLIKFNLEKGPFKAFSAVNISASKKFNGWENKLSFYEAYVSYTPSHSFKFNLGKMRLKWGKGYAWNPVAFVDRPKNPNDPELAMEGFFVFSFDYIKSFKGILKTISISPLILPVTDKINLEFSDKSTIIFGGKIYLLLSDIDIDLMFLSGAYFADRFGLDFSKNLSSNIEVHGEVNFIPDLKQDERVSYLLGVRFLTRSDITFILEYYKNGNDLSSEDMENYFLQIDEAYKLYYETGESKAIELIQETTDPLFRSFAPMSDYLYLRVSQKEPFDILYLVPSITSIYNLVDHSFSITPEFIYTPVTNLELRAKITLFKGRAGSDFGEKQNKFRFEFRGRYYF